ncbi:hypothetical protein BGZ65_001020, partial [Modicella reniformis]
RLHPDKPDYHAAGEILKHTFDAMIRRIWEVELKTTDLESHLVRIPIREVHRTITAKAHTIREKYFTNTDSLVQAFATTRV